MDKKLFDQQKNHFMCAHTTHKGKAAGIQQNNNNKLSN